MSCTGKISSKFVGFHLTGVISLGVILVGIILLVCALHLNRNSKSMDVDFGCPSTLGKKVVSPENISAVVAPHVILSLECETGSYWEVTVCVGLTVLVW